MFTVHTSITANSQVPGLRVPVRIRDHLPFYYDVIGVEVRKTAALSGHTNVFLQENEWRDRSAVDFSMPIQ